MPSNTTGMNAPSRLSHAPFELDTVIVSVSASPGTARCWSASETACGWNGTTLVSATFPNLSVNESVRYLPVSPCAFLSIAQTQV